MQDFELIRVHRKDYYHRREAIIVAFGSDLQTLVSQWYGIEQLSAQEICDRLAEKDIKFSQRSIQRIATEKLGIGRSVGDAFRLAASKGRIKWAFKDPRFKTHRKWISRKLRMQIFRRDNYRCVLCGADAKTVMLEIDHIVPLVFDGKTKPENLRVLCNSCNVGKAVLDKEH